MSDDRRINEILSTIQKIKESNLSVTDYFDQNIVPFSRAQYYNYCKILQKYGEEGLKDKRTEGNNAKLTQRIKDYIVSIVKENQSISSTQLRTKILNQFNIDISKTCLNSFRSSESISRIPLPEEIEYQHQKSSGGELLTSLAFFTHLIEMFTKTIIDQKNYVQQSELFQKNIEKGEDYPDIRSQGKFTKEYNQILSVRKNRFRSIDDKIQEKNLSSMNIFELSEETISRYNLALLCLPLVTSNGKSSRVNRAKGNDLTFLCGYNYKDASLDRYIRDLKYLKISEQLIMATAKFWIDFWRNEYKEETYFVCYYIDGNTKALWSSNRCYKGKVVMLGRVMNCLENVFIHDSKGHPLYFQTFQGHADLGKHALNMIAKLNGFLSDPTANVQVKRIMVFDAGGNGVKTLREFKNSDDYFITMLDDNQATERKFKHIHEETKYKYGKADLVDCLIELLDSSEKNYIFECRAVVVKWNNGRKSVLVTSIPRELLDESEVVKKYFDRWPMQEKTFREAKSCVNIHRIVGYGKKVEKYEKMDENHRKICEKITQLQTELNEPLGKIEGIEIQLADLYQKERKLREKSSIVNGERVLNDADSIELHECESQIKKCLYQQKKIEKEHEADFEMLKKYLKEERRIRDKDKVYRIDTELDQIMTCFKMSFVNLCSYFLKRCFDGGKMELLTLFESIFHLTGNAEIADGKKTIVIDKNPKESDLMDKLNIGLSILNQMEIIDLDGRLIDFRM